MPVSGTRRGRWFAAGTAATALALALTVAAVGVSLAGTTPVGVTDRATFKASTFTAGTMAPFRTCTTQKPNYSDVQTVDKNKAMRFVWTSAGYDGTRMDRGSEACSSLSIHKEGWYGLRFRLPATQFPRDKNTIIAQIFDLGGCKSWAGTLSVRGNELFFDHRGSCGTPTSVRLDTNIARDRWLPITVHFVASRAKAGTIEIWYKDAPRNQPTYRATGINFASFGTYAGDSLAPVTNNSLGLKFGMYCYDAARYTPNETRTIYFDNISQLDGNPGNAFDMVHPVLGEPHQPAPLPSGPTHPGGNPSPSASNPVPGASHPVPGASHPVPGASHPAPGATTPGPTWAAYASLIEKLIQAFRTRLAEVGAAMYRKGRGWKVSS